MPSFFSPPKPPSLPPPPPPPPSPEDPAVAQRAQALREQERLRRGRSSTIITGGQGVLGDTAVNRPAGATLLGG